MGETHKPVAFFLPQPFCYAASLRRAAEQLPIATWTVPSAGRLRDIRSELTVEIERLLDSDKALACAVVFTDEPLTAATLEPERVDHASVPLYAINRSAALAWAISTDHCRFVLVDLSGHGTITLIKRGSSGAIEDVRLYNASLEALLGCEIASNELPIGLASCLGQILRITNGFGYAACAVVSDVFADTASACRFSATLAAEVSEDFAVSALQPEPALFDGALSAICASASSPGASRDPFRSPCTLAMTASRPVAYPVAQVQRPVFDLREPALADTLSGRPVLLAVDTTVASIYGMQIRNYAHEHLNVFGEIQIEAGEENKSLEHVERVWNVAVDAGLPRHGVIVGIGGGVALDIAGMAAATFRRGVGYIRIATTLLGMIDVAVGIKHAVNFSGRKNIIGMFYPPVAAINDPSFLTTNSARQLACGIAETIKIAMVADRRLFELLDEHLATLLDTHFQTPPPVAHEILVRAQLAMMRELAPNLYETDLQRAVDFGHSISPSLEAGSNYRLQHGEAVAIDMLFSTAVSVSRGMCDPSLLIRLERIYQMCGLPLHDPLCTLEFVKDALREVTAHRGGRLNLVLPTGVGTYEFAQHVTERELLFALSAMSNALGTAVEAG